MGSGPLVTHGSRQTLEATMGMRKILVLLTTMGLVGAVLTTWPVGVAGATTTGAGAYVWANQPTSSSYTPMAAYAYDLSLIHI